MGERAPNLAGLKVSEPSFADVVPYLGLGLPVLVGFEPLIVPALAAGATGTVSGLAAAFLSRSLSRDFSFAEFTGPPFPASCGLWG